MNQKLRYIFFLFLYFTAFLNAQQQQHDSLAKYSYEELFEKIKLYRTGKKSLAKIYIHKYLIKAKKAKDSTKITNGYYELARIHYIENQSLSLKYADSTIAFSTIIKNYKMQSYGYYLKGYIYYQRGKDHIALDNFFKALECLKIEKNVPFEIDVRTTILSIQSNWIYNEDKLSFSKENLAFIIKNKEHITDYHVSHAIALNNLAAEYIRNKYYKKAIETITIGLKLCSEFKHVIEKHTNDINYHDFVSLAGTAQYYLGNYQAAIDSSLKSLPHLIKINDRNVIMEYYYLAKSYNKLNQPEKAQFHFLKTDSIYQATKDIFPEMRNAYEHIIDYYKSKNDTENQIKYYDRLIETDAKIDSVYKYVNETIQKKYETPQAIAERARLVEEAQEKENAWKYNFGISSAILVAILGILVFVFRRQKYYKKRFEEVMSKKDLSTALKVTNQENEIKKKEIDIPEAIIESILKKLSKFEASKGFTKQLTLAQLAKKLGTNQKYLSKVINWHYKKSYSAYINDLRVHYVISKLKEETTFRNYTIKAIAEEVGFGNAAAFAKAFSKTTGINPSYFIKELQKR